MKGKLFNFISLALLLSSLPAVIGSYNASAQKFAVKTNLLYDATATVTAGVEFKLADHWTLDILGNWNSWSKASDADPKTVDPKWMQKTIQPQVRYFFKDAFKGHFVGLHALTGTYTLGGTNLPFKIILTDFRNFKNKNFMGWCVGGGVGYGYAIRLGGHWNLELEASVGYLYFDYDFKHYSNGNVYDGVNTHHYIGPTKLAISIAYLF
jgi:opacity protein-like surface antigen